MVLIDKGNDLRAFYRNNHVSEFWMVKAKQIGKNVTLNEPDRRNQVDYLAKLALK